MRIPTSIPMMGAMETPLSQVIAVVLFWMTSSVGCSGTQFVVPEGMGALVTLWGASPPS